MTKENLMCPNQKASTPKSRENWDRIFNKDRKHTELGSNPKPEKVEIDGNR